MRTPPVLLGTLLWPLAACFVDPGSYASATAATTPSTSTSTSPSTSTTEALTTPTDTGPDPIAVCGDGLVGGAETCDDGNQNDGDGCSALCLQEPGNKLYVFATLGKFNGNINGIDGADVKCQSEADNNQLPGTYLAWLSVSPEACPANRFASHDLRYVLPGEGEPVVAFGTAQLLSSNHERGIDRGPDGVPFNAPIDCELDALAWTGTNSDGNFNGNTCKGFTTASFGELGAAGKLVGTDTGWSAGCSVPCSESLRLYCMQQP
jgi:cysteine-rich repeat protein